MVPSAMIVNALTYNVDGRVNLICDEIRKELRYRPFELDAASDHRDAGATDRRSRADHDELTNLATRSCTYNASFTATPAQRARPGAALRGDTTEQECRIPRFAAMPPDTDSSPLLTARGPRFLPPRHYFIYRFIVPTRPPHDDLPSLLHEIQCVLDLGYTRATHGHHD